MGETAAQIDRYSRQIDELSTESTQEKLASMTAASTISEIQLRMQTVEQTLAEKRERAETLKQSDADFAKMLADTESRIQALSNTVKGYEMRLNSRRQRAEAAKKQSENCIWTPTNAPAAPACWRIWSAIWRAFPKASSW